MISFVKGRFTITRKIFEIRHYAGEEQQWSSHVADSRTNVYTDANMESRIMAHKINELI